MKLTFANALVPDEIHPLGKHAEALLVHRGIIPADDWMRATRIGGNGATPSRSIVRLRTITLHQRSRSTSRSARAAHVVYRNHIQIISEAPVRTRAFANPLSIPLPAIARLPRWIEPDALFGIGDRFSALEADMGTESIEAVIKPNIKAYLEIVASRMIDNHFSVDNLNVLFVTTNKRRMHNIMAAVASIVTGGRTTMFGFAYRPDLAQFTRAPALDSRMFREAWQRVGYEDFRLDSKISEHTPLAPR